jgi:DNA-binding CsgD family transcriptional regulator
MPQPQMFTPAGGASPVVGRQQEIRRLQAFIAQIAVQSGVLLLTGEAGVGKTVLLDLAATEAATAGVRVLRATGAQFEADVSFAGLHQVLQPCLGEVPQLSTAHAQALNVALGLGAGPPPGQLLVANAVVALLKRAAAEQPVLLIIDDLPWLDRASALVLSMVARRLTASNVGLLAASRSGEDGYFEAGDLPIGEVWPLAEEAATLLLTTRFPALTPRVRQRLLSEAQGNPLALLELPVAIAGLRPAAGGALPAVLPLGRRLQSVFVSRIKSLPAATYRLLLLAVLDGTGDLLLIDALAAEREGEGLAPAERVGLVQARESTQQVIFRHPLIRSAVVEVSTSQQRRQAHRELARHFADRPERRAWHLAEAAIEPDEHVAALLQQVAHTNLRRGDSVGAVTELLRAAELSPAGSDRSARLAEAAYLGSIVTGDLQDAPQLLQAARRAHPGPGGPLSAAVAGAYHLLHGDGDIDTAHHLLVNAINELDNPRDARNKVLIEALYTLLMICFFGGRAELWTPFQSALGRLLPRPPELLAVLGATFSDPARLTPPMLERLDASIAGLTRQGSPARIVRTGIAAAYLDRLAGCREGLWRAVHHGREGGAVTSAIEALFLLGQDAYHAGQWEHAQQVVDEGLKLCEAHGYKLLTWPGMLITALLAATRGDCATVTALAGQMNGWAAPRRARAVQMYAAHAQSLVALGHGDFEAAYRHASTISPAGELASHVPHALWVFLDLVEAAVHTGRRDEAAAHVAAARLANLDTISPRLRLVVLGSAAIADPGHGSLFDEALAIPGADRWPFDLARIHLAYGAHLRRIKSTTQARLHLSIAWETLQRLGARPWATRANNELRATGLTIGAAATTGLASLTQQQRQIALLAATGLTNKQIGERLFLSPRTVSTHLYQVFPKLGVTSRAALRDALRDLPDG